MVHLSKGFSVKLLSNEDFKYFLFFCFSICLCELCNLGKSVESRQSHESWCNLAPCRAILHNLAPDKFSSILYQLVQSCAISRSLDSSCEIYCNRNLVHFCAMWYNPMSSRAIIAVPRNLAPSGVIRVNLVSC